MGSLLSDVEDASVGVEHRLLHHFGQSGMREYRMDELLFRCFEVHGDNIALNEFSDLRSNHVRSDQSTGSLVEDHLDHALIFAKRDRLPIPDKRKTTNANVKLLLLGRLLGHAH